MGRYRLWYFGKALLTIRDARLYREQFGTIEAYCRARWSISSQRAHQLIDSAEVMGNLSTVVDKLTTERHARELASLDADGQQAVWEIVTETAPKTTGASPSSRPTFTASSS